MGNTLFSAEELAALAAFDAEIDADDELTLEEYAEAAKRDKQAELAARDNKYRSIAAQKRAYYEANKGEIAAQKRAYYEANKDEIAAKQRAYREANKGEIAAKKRAYYEANKDEIAAKQRAYREANKDEIRRRNREYMREYRRRHDADHA